MDMEPIMESDLQYLRELQPEGWPDITPVFINYLRRPFCTPVKVMSERKIVAIGAGISWGKTAWLAHIIVAPEHRNKGIGGSLVGQLLHSLQNSGCETISLIATDMGYPVYKKAGFIEQTEYVFFEKETPLKDIALSEEIIRLPAAKTQEIMVLDQTASGENRSNLLTDELNNCYVYLKKGRTLGYYLPGLGEGLIIANDNTAGIELMKLKYSITSKGSLPAENKDGIKFLKDNGFRETKTVKRMIWGKEFLWHPVQIYSRIGGNLG